MGGIENRSPIAVPAGTIELRVHGVSGTPPEGLLRDRAIKVAGGPTTGFFRVSDDVGRRLSRRAPGFVEAYSWGGLTSGSRLRSALRLLLLPFALINVAGWMLPGVVRDGDDAPSRPREGEHAGEPRRHAAMARLAALAMTAYAGVAAYWVGLTAVTQLGFRYDWPWPQQPREQAAAAALVAVAMVAIWMVVARRRTRIADFEPEPEIGLERPTPGGPADLSAMAAAPATAIDPSSEEGPGVASLWTSPFIARRLGRIHAAVALATIAGVHLTVLAADGPIALAAAVAAGVGGLVALATLFRPGLLAAEDAGWEATATVALCLAGAGVVGALFQRPAPGSEYVAGLEAAGTRLLWWLVGIVVTAAIALAAQQTACAGPAGRLGRLHAPAFAVLGFATALTGVAGVTAVILVIARGRTLPLGDFQFVVAVAVSGLVAVCVAACVVVLRLRPANSPGSVGFYERLRDTAGAGRGVIVLGAVVFAVLALALGTGETVNLVDLNRDGAPGWASAGWAAVLALVVCVLLSLDTHRRRIALPVAAGVAAVVVSVAAVTVDGGWAAMGNGADEALSAVAIVGALLAPVGAVGWFAYQGSANPGARQVVGVFWDIASFWPRHFHPWAPPPYTDVTIPDLADRVRHLRRTEGTRTVILSGHSQGAVIAVPALQRLCHLDGDADGAPVALLTYGNLLDAHYRRLFPWVFDPALVAAVDECVEHRWINLFRTTDPLGHPIPALGDRDRDNSQPPLLDMGPTSTAKTLNHADYQYGEQYQPALDQLAAPREP